MATKIYRRLPEDVNFALDLVKSTEKRTSRAFDRYSPNFERALVFMAEDMGIDLQNGRNKNAPHFYVAEGRQRDRNGDLYLNVLFVTDKKRDAIKAFKRWESDLKKDPLLNFVRLDLNEYFLYPKVPFDETPVHYSILKEILFAMAMPDKSLHFRKDGKSLGGRLRGRKERVYTFEESVPVSRGMITRWETRKFQAKGTSREEAKRNYYLKEAGLCGRKRRKRVRLRGGIPKFISWSYIERPDWGNHIPPNMKRNMKAAYEHLIKLNVPFASVKANTMYVYFNFAEKICWIYSPNDKYWHKFYWDDGYKSTWKFNPPKL